MSDLQKTESVIAMATVLNFNNTLKSINLNRPLLFSHQVTTSHVTLIKVIANFMFAAFGFSD